MAHSQNGFGLLPPKHCNHPWSESLDKPLILDTEYQTCSVCCRDMQRAWRLATSDLSTRY